MKNSARVFSLAVLGLAAVACGKSSPVGHLEVQPQSLTVGYPDSKPLHLSWEPASALDSQGGAPTVFVHLLDRTGRLVRTYDHPFPQEWQEGVPVGYDVKIFQSALAPPLPVGRYQLTVGLYGNKTGKRWPLDVAGQDLRRFEYHVADVEVPTAGPGPHFSYVGPWLPSEPGGSRQVVARRWLDGPGALRVERLAGPGTLWLVVHIPAGVGVAEKLVFADASNTPSVVISSTCNGGVETGVSGPGGHEIEIPAVGTPSDGSCAIHLKPNFRLLKVGQRPRSVAIENAAWSPASTESAGPAPASPTAPAPGGPGANPGGARLP